MPRLDQEKIDKSKESGPSFPTWFKDRQLVEVPFDVVEWTQRHRDGYYLESGDYVKERDEVVMTIMFTDPIAIDRLIEQKLNVYNVPDPENPEDVLQEEVAIGTWYGCSSGAKAIVGLLKDIDADNKHDDSLPLEMVTIKEDKTRNPFKGYYPIYLDNFELPSEELPSPFDTTSPTMTPPPKSGSSTVPQKATTGPRR